MGRRQSVSGISRRAAAGGAQEDTERHEGGSIEQRFRAGPLTCPDLIRLFHRELLPSAVPDSKEPRSTGRKTMKPDARSFSLPDRHERPGDLFERPGHPHDWRAARLRRQLGNPGNGSAGDLRFVLERQIARADGHRHGQRRDHWESAHAAIMGETPRRASLLSPGAGVRLESLAGLADSPPAERSSV